MGLVGNLYSAIKKSKNSSKYHAILQGVKHPRKRLYRARAHSNPLNDANFDVPAHPAQYDWHGPALKTPQTENLRRIVQALVMQKADC